MLASVLDRCFNSLEALSNSELMSETVGDGVVDVGFGCWKFSLERGNVKDERREVLL